MRTLVRLAAGLAKLLAGLVLALLVFGAGTWFQARGALPPYAGRFEAKGLKAPVEILRDSHAVPHIIAGSVEDAAFGLGFVHAQDRFWQMELMRRLGQGRLSEILPPAIVGSGIVETDRTMRGLGVYRAASDSVGALSPAIRSILDAYAAGVNAWLADDDQQYGLELTLIKLLTGGRYKPEPWQPADSMVWAKLMALQLDGNWRGELLRLRLAKKIGEDATKFLMDRPSESRDATLALANEALNGLDLDRLYRETDNEATRKREASNEWALSGAHSVSGKPLLANDPHLGLAFPGTWYLARLVGPGFDIRGATSPGSPGVVLGHNGSIGWGFTTTNLDSQDLFIERIDTTDPSRYVTPDGARPFTVRDETISVLWGEPVRLKVRSTRHGVVIDDFVRKPEQYSASGHVLALQATALDGGDTSLEGLLRISQAQNWNDFLNAARKVLSPMQNVVYADTAGNIGLVAPARVPIRRKGDGSIPSPGWTGEYDWAGFVPFDDLPRTYNPPSGIIVNANARLVPDDYRYFITNDWAEPYRQRRANQLLREVERHPVFGMTIIQGDILTPDAADMLPLLLKPEPRNARATRVRELMGRWNRFMLARRPEPLIYEAWLWELQRGLLADRLGDELFFDMTAPRVTLLMRILRDKPDWCDNPKTPAAETCDDAIAAALDRALDWIARRQGNDIDAWQWGIEHPAAHRHPFFDAIPLLRDVASVRFPFDGGGHTLNRATPSFRGPRPFEAVHGAGYRGVYDFSDLDNSRFAIPLGQSGNMLSRWSTSFVDNWRALRYVEIAGTRAEVVRSAVGVITLSPAR
ncbi:MAG: penicillin acylase family protein [Reyranella sp.]|uniref:penicillin acylase family protein n=1 Tax=Reyranella sp. TaxID=1929291 RepID=UPI001AC25F61|nr:penicillin acylase family protein [Reyranella sp.]MBN9088659.1 penicillin acylase family protein [Reyranella sp.]